MFSQKFSNLLSTLLPSLSWNSQVNCIILQTHLPRHISRSPGWKIFLWFLHTLLHYEIDTRWLWEHFIYGRHKIWHLLYSWSFSSSYSCNLIFCLVGRKYLRDCFLVVINLLVLWFLWFLFLSCCCLELWESTLCCSHNTIKLSKKNN